MIKKYAENKKIEELRKYMLENNMKVCLLFEPDNQYYITKFKAITYSRQIVTVVTQDSLSIIVPSLESIHAETEAEVDKIIVYYEIPEMDANGLSHFDHLDKILSTYLSNTVIGIEKSFVSVQFSEYLKEKGFQYADVGSFIARSRYIKDPLELSFIKIAGFLSDIGIKGSLENVKPGMNEMEFENIGDRIMQEYISKHYPDTYVDFENWTNSGIQRTVMPHLFTNSRMLKRDDVVIHSRQVWFNGYRAENERTFILGKPTSKQLDVFKVAIEAQQAGLDVIKAGIRAKDVDAAARAVCKKHGLELYANHRIGHGLGLSEHEEPYLRFDNELILEEGMVFSMEPGIYVPGIGGFRHSDTAIVEKNGACIPTTYTRNAEDLIFDV